MKVYLKKIDTNETIKTFENIIDWNKYFVEYSDCGHRIKIYCGEEEYFTDIKETENN